MGIYLWFKIYFLIDTNTKMWTEITDLVILGRNYWSSGRVELAPVPRHGPPGNTPLLVTSGGQDQKPVQTCSLEDPFPSRAYIWWQIIQWMRAIRILLECFLVSSQTTVFVVYSQQRRFIFDVWSFSLLLGVNGPLLDRYFGQEHLESYNITFFVQRSSQSWFSAIPRLTIP